MHSSTIAWPRRSAKIEPGVDALRQQVQRERDDVDVAGALAVPEQRPLDAVGAGHQPELRGRHRGAAVVVRVDREDDLVARGEVALEPLESVGVHVRRERLDRRRQVDDHLLLGRRPPRRCRRLADLERIVELGAVEALGRVLEDDLGVGLRGELLAEDRAADGEVGDAVLVEPEDDAALRLGGRVVEVDDRAARALDRLVGALDQLGPRLREHGDRRVVRDQVLLDEAADELEVGLRRRREADLDLLHAERDEQVEHLLLARRVHRLDEGLVPVAQVGRAPDGRAVDDAVRPGAVGQVDGLVGAVLLKGIVMVSGPPRERGSQDADVLLAVVRERERICRDTLPLEGKEEAERKQAAGAGRRSSRVEAIAATLAASVRRSQSG